MQEWILGDGSKEERKTPKTDAEMSKVEGKGGNSYGKRSVLRGRSEKKNTER